MLGGCGAPHPRPCGRAERPALLQKQVCEGQYGPGMAELEQQVAEHNILQKEIEAYGQQLRTLVGPVGEPLTHAPVWPKPWFHFSHQSLSEVWLVLGDWGWRRGRGGPGMWGAFSPVPHLSLGLRFLPLG